MRTETRGLSGVSPTASPSDELGIRAEETVIALARAWGTSQLYPPSHPAVQQQYVDAEARVAAALAGPAELTLKRLNGELVHEDRRLFVERPRPAGFVVALSDRGVDCLTFSRGTTAAELSALCRALATDPEELRHQGGVSGFLKTAGVRHIALDELAVAGASTGTGLGVMSLVELRSSAIAVARQTMCAVIAEDPIDVAANAAAVEDLLTCVSRDRAAAVSLASIKGHDEYTFSHSVHAALLSMALGDAIGLDQDELRQLGVAAMLHDVGKVFVPTEVLRKPGRLSGLEWELMGRHPVDGAAVLLECGDLSAMAPMVAFEHHLNCDLSGYPKVRRRAGISLWSMIVSLADVYDALTSCRPYRAALPPEAAAVELDRMAGDKADPRLVEWFREMLGVYPPGTGVLLDTGERAVVCQGNPHDATRPLVCVLTDPSGAPLADPFEVRLDEDRRSGGAYRRSIAGVEMREEDRVRAAWALENWLGLACVVSGPGNSSN